MEDRLFNLDEVSQYLKISKSTLYKLSQRNKIPSVKIGKQLRFRKSSLDAWLAGREGDSVHPAGKNSSVLNIFLGSGKNRSSKRILLVDDDELVLKTLGRFLDRQGFKVELATSGEIALSKAKATNFDLIIADVRMPGINGIETITKLREFNRQHKRQEPAEIIITGFMDTHAQQQAEKLGIADFVYKPFAISDFMEMVRTKLCQTDKIV